MPATECLTTNCAHYDLLQKYKASVSVYASAVGERDAEILKLREVLKQALDRISELETFPAAH